jgi:endonuclease YncB( thermonuclease family)
MVSLKGKSMKKLFAVLLLVPVLAVAQTKAPKEPKGVMYDAQIIRVTDGDTIVISAPFLPAPLKPQLAVRIYGVDTPEKGHRAQCPQEAQRAELASKYTSELIARGGKIQVILYKWDKFGGRVIGDIVVNGQSVRHGLIANGLAREYYGDAKVSWCQ